jgi:uncharacterized membrane protein
MYIYIYLHKYANGRNMIFLAVVWILFVVAFNHVFADLNGNILDTRLYYNGDDAYLTIEGYGTENRQTYIRGTLLLDFAYPLVYSILLALIIIKLRGQTRLMYLPFGVLLLDYLENIMILSMLGTFPTRLELVAQLAGIVTALKWAFAGATLLTILYFSIRKLMGVIRLKFAKE